MLRFAFPHKIYAERQNTQVNPVTAGDNLRNVMNARDIWSDTVKNFSASYSNYAHIDDGDTPSRSEQPIWFFFAKNRFFFVSPKYLNFFFLIGHFSTRQSQQAIQYCLLHVSSATAKKIMGVIIVLICKVTKLSVFFTEKIVSQSIITVSIVCFLHKKSARFSTRVNPCKKNIFAD